MKHHYSGKHLIVYSLATGILVFLLMLGFGMIAPRSKRVKKSDHPITSLTGADSSAPDPLGSRDGKPWKQELSLTGMIEPVSTTTGGFTEDERLNIDIYERLNGGVVNITTQVIEYNWFLEPVPSQGASGSGSIIDRRGYILTNNHVVDKAYKVSLTLSDGAQFEGEVVGVDPENDLAVIKFDPGDRDLVTIPFGNSAPLKVGQKVLAIGNPYGLERTLTTGIVSGLGRPLRNSLGLVMKDMIQTDASINPGNSGGPLLSIHGEMIGINTMIYSPSGGSVGIGFAVPVDIAKRVVPDLLNFGKVLRGWIDIVPIQLFPSLVRYAELPVREGVLVSRVRPESTASQGGLRGGDRSRAVRSGDSVIYLGGDIIVSINGMTVNSLSSYYGALEKTKPGQTVEVGIIRGKKQMTLKVKLSERPDKYLWD